MTFRRLLPLLFSALFPLMAQQPEKPKLVIGIVIDQFRYDYLTRFRSGYHGGLDLLLRNGADFTNAHYMHVPTVTAVGHSIFMSGAMPAVSGIISNTWYDRASKKSVTSVCDWSETVVGGRTATKGPNCTDEDPASPRKFLVSTVGDELRDVDDDSKVVGISLKARAAILPSGHRANGAFWFDIRSGKFVTSSYYMHELPHWASEFNEKKLPAGYLDKKWPNFPSWSFKAAGENQDQYQKIPASPWGNELVEKFAESALAGEQLGQRGHTDLMTVSFSSNDYIGHAVGPDAPEVRDMAIRVDELIGQLLQLVDEKVGLKNTVVVLTADHGVSPAPKVNEARKMPGVYVHANPAQIVKGALDREFGAADWVESGNAEGIYFNRSVLNSARMKDGRPVAIEGVYRIAKQALLAEPELHAVRVYDAEQLANGIAGDFLAQAFVNGFFPRESPDLAIAYEPYAMPGHGSGTSHFSPYDYDRHVPILFMGPGIKPGRYNEEVKPNDIAATLATMLSIETPSGSSGRVLTKMLQ